MKKRLIYSLLLLFILFTAGSMLTIFHIYRTTKNLRTVIEMHRVEIIRQNLVINAQTVQTNLYTIGTIFGKQVDEIVQNVIDLDDSVHLCMGCHHGAEMTAKLNEMNGVVEEYKNGLSFLITTSANPERLQRLRAVAIDIGNNFIKKSQEMSGIANKRLTERTVKSLQEINNSRVILVITLMLSFFIALAIAVSMTRQITEPINELVSATRRIKSGDLGYVTPYRTKGEFGELVSSFNDMSSTLKESNNRIMRYLHSLSNLYSITLAFHSVANRSDIFRELSHGIAELTGAGQCGIFLRSEDGREFALMYPAVGISEEQARDVKVPSEVIEELYHSSRRKALMLNDNLLASPTAEYDRALGTRNLMYVWVRHKGRLIGIIRAANKAKGEFFTEEDARLLAILANNFSVALENARLYENLRNQMKVLEETQGQLVQAAKLVAIGELASNVAHEINNPLTSILGYAELIKDERDLEKVLRDVELIEKESLRARDIVHQLLQFSRKQPLSIRAVDVNRLLASVIELMNVQIRDSRIKVEKDFSGVPLIEGDENQLKQVFLNMISNAIYSMHNEGTLGVRTLSARDTVVAEISDTGAGIPGEIRDRIFEPFFTTKSEKGTGLGLSISLKIVQGHGGRIEVDSQPGKGSRFRVMLPVSALRKPSGGTATPS